MSYLRVWETSGSGLTSGCGCSASLSLVHSEASDCSTDPNDSTTPTQDLHNTHRAQGGHNERTGQGTVKEGGRALQLGGKGRPSLSVEGCPCDLSLCWVTCRGRRGCGGRVWAGSGGRARAVRGHCPWGSTPQHSHGPTITSHHIEKRGLSPDRLFYKEW